MTFAEIETRARDKARSSVSGASQSTVFDIINDAIVTFGRDVQGLPYKEYPALAERFDLETHFGFHIEITGSSDNDCDTDVAVTDVDASDQTGSQVATELQAQIRAAIGAGATLTVAWTDFYFTIDSIDGTSIEITEPSDGEAYADYTEELFGGTISATDSSVEGGFPEGCTIEATLATDMITINQVTWDDRRVLPIPREEVITTRSNGTPAYYYIRGRNIGLYPSPSSQKKLYIEYKGVPTQVTNPQQDDDIPDIPEQYQSALVFYVAYELLLNSFEDDKAMGRYSFYRKIVNQYKANNANNNPSMAISSSNPLWYTVNTESG